VIDRARGDHVELAETERLTSPGNRNSNEYEVVSVVCEILEQFADEAILYFVQDDASTLNDSTRNVLFSADETGDEDAEEMRSIHSSKLRWDPADHEQDRISNPNDGEALVTQERAHVGG
jgi:hypothetical protein